MAHQRKQRDRLVDNLTDIISAHRFQQSRPYEDGSEPTAPHWNPGCSCGEAMYFFEHDTHLAEKIAWSLRSKVLRS